MLMGHMCPIRRPLSAVRVKAALHLKVKLITFWGD